MPSPTGGASPFVTTPAPTPTLTPRAAREPLPNSDIVLYHTAADGADATERAAAEARATVGAQLEAALGTGLLVDVGTLRREYVRKRPPMVVVVADDEVERVHLHRLCLELKHNPAATFVRGHGYLRRCAAARTLLPPHPHEVLLPPGGLVYVDCAFANAQPKAFEKAVAAVREVIGRTQPWKVVVVSTDGADGKEEPNEATRAVLRERKGEASLLDERRWQALLGERMEMLPPMLLRVALRESAKEEVARKHRHAVVLSPHPSVAEAAAAQQLQLSVVSSAAELADHLTSIKEATEAVAVREGGPPGFATLASSPASLASA